MRGLLLAIGLLLLGGTAVVWLAIPSDDSTSTVGESSTVSVESKPGPTTSTQASTGAGQTTTADAPTTPSDSTTVSKKTTETTTPAASRRTDAALALLVALGLALVLMGAFFDRITSIKAAGVEVSLGARLTEAIASKTTPETPEERAKVRAAYVLALERLTAGRGYDPPTSGGDDPVIDSAADAALRSVNADFE